MHIKPVLFATVMATAACAGSTREASRPPNAAPGEQSAAAGASYGRLVRTARAFLESGKPERAAELAEQAVSKEATRPDAYLVWGLALAQLGQLDDSAAKLEAAKAHGGTERLLFAALASVYDVSHRYDDSQRIYREYLASHPDDAGMHQQLGLTLLLVERLDEAVAELRRAASLAPNELQLQQDLGYALLRAGKPAEAARILQVVVEREPARHDARIFLARARAAQGNPGDALALLDGLLAANAKDEPALRMRAKLRAIAGDPAGAAGDYRVLLALRPDDPAALLGLAGALIAQGRLEEAAQICTRVRASADGNPLLELREAQLAWRRGDREALATIARFAHDNPRDVVAWRELRAAARKYKNRKLEKEAAARLRELGG